MASVKRTTLTPWIAVVVPTAQASFGPLAETPSRRSSWRTMFGVGTCCHCVPFSGLDAGVLPGHDEVTDVGDVASTNRPEPFE